MNNTESLRIIAGWLNNLAELTRHGEDGRPTKNRLATIATMLGRDFPAGAFTTDSLHAAAQGIEWFPPYDTIRQQIGEWWRENQTTCPRALPAHNTAADAATSELTTMDRYWLNYFSKRASEGFGPLCDGDAPSGRARCLDLVRCQSPDAFAVIQRSA